jgi:hypothetical protein
MRQTLFVRQSIFFSLLAIVIVGGFIFDSKQAFATKNVTAAECLSLFGGGCNDPSAGGYFIGACTDQPGKNCVTGAIAESQCQAIGGTCDGGNVNTGACPAGKTAKALCDFLTFDYVCCVGTATDPAPTGGTYNLETCKAVATGAACATTQPANTTKVGDCFPVEINGSCYKPTDTGTGSTGTGTGTGSTGSGTGTGTGSTGSGTGTGTGSTGSGTGTGSTGATTISFENPLKFNTVQDVLGSLLTTLQGIIVILAIVFIVIGAVLYITSAGNSKQTEMAKSAITAAMIGLAIGIAAPSFLREISSILGWNAAPANVSGAISLTAILTNILTFLTGIAGILAIIMLIIGAIMYLSAAGDEDRIDTGKKIVKFSIIGIIIAFSALLLVKQIASLFIV